MSGEVRAILCAAKELTEGNKGNEGSRLKMKLLAKLGPNEANEVAARLKAAGIACESRSVTEESGVVATELLVEEAVYEAACDVIDLWLDDQSRGARMICPKCKSTHLERVPHDRVEVLFKCADCGCEILAQA